MVFNPFLGSHCRPVPILQKWAGGVAKQKPSEEGFIFLIEVPDWKLQADRLRVVDTLCISPFAGIVHRIS